MECLCVHSKRSTAQHSKSMKVRTPQEYFTLKYTPLSCSCLTWIVSRVVVGSCSPSGFALSVSPQRLAACLLRLRRGLHVRGRGVFVSPRTSTWSSPVRDESWTTCVAETLMITRHLLPSEAGNSAPGGLGDYRELVGVKNNIEVDSCFRNGAVSLHLGGFQRRCS